MPDKSSFKSELIADALESLGIDPQHEGAEELKDIIRQYEQDVEAEKHSPRYGGKD